MNPSLGENGSCISVTVPKKQKTLFGRAKIWRLHHTDVTQLAVFVVWLLLVGFAISGYQVYLTSCCLLVLTFDRVDLKSLQKVGYYIPRGVSLNWRDLGHFGRHTIVSSPNKEFDLQLITEPVQQNLVPTLILLLHALLLQITPCSHKAMHLIIKPLDDMIRLNVLLPIIHVILALILTRQHHKRNRDTLGIIGVHHCWVTRRGRLELRVLARKQVGDLAAPAVPHDAPGLDVLVLLLGFADDLGHALERLGWCGLCLEELAEELLLLFVVGWEVVDGDGLAVEEVGHDDQGGLFAVAVCEDVGALESLGEEAKDVVDDEDGAGGV